MKLKPEWKELIIDYLKTQQARDLYSCVEHEYKTQVVCPPKDKVFAAFDKCMPDDVKVVIIGQDPYFNAGQAVGMSFSIDPTAKDIQFPPSLRNIIKEVKDEFGTCEVENGDLSKWADQGVLLLNSTLTVRLGQPMSHSNIGWTQLTNAVIKSLNKKDGIVFVLWGSHAGKCKEFLTNSKNLVLICAHPSPLSADRGFFGCGHFKKINEFLQSIGKEPIKW